MSVHVAACDREIKFDCRRRGATALCSKCLVNFDFLLVGADHLIIITIIIHNNDHYYYVTY